MTQQQGEIGIEDFCGLAGVARAGYYRYWVQTEPQEADGELRDRIQRICLAHRSYGYRRVRAALRKQGLVVNHKKIRRIMREDNLLAIRRRKWITTTDSRHQLAIFPNLAPFMEPDGADQVWVADLTYIRLRSEFVYLAVVLDVWSRRVVGWALERELTTTLPKKALLQAIAERQPAAGLVHHSDRGVQYASLEYVTVLHEHQIVGSMSRTGYPYDNAGQNGAKRDRRIYDMGRLSSMTQGENSVATATYGVAGELTTLWTANFGTETHTYNSMFQLTRIRALDPPGAAVDLEYRYPAGQNNGRITQAVDCAAGEEVTYTYDALQRLTKAETTGPQWGQAYSYDGFGNLTGKTVTKGLATTLSLAIDAATNRPAGVNYDANGNAPIGMWDVENRLVMRAAAGAPITYDPSNQRVMQYKVEPNDLGDYPTWTISLYGLGGERAGDVKCIRFDINNFICRGTAEPTFGDGRRLAVVDRLGSTRAGRPPDAL